MVTVEDQLEEAVSTLGLSTTRCKELASRYPIEAKQQIQEVLSQSLAAASRQDAPEATSEPPVLDPKDFTFEHSEFSSGPVDVAMSRRRRSYGRIVRVGQKKFLIRYYNILGRNAFQPDSPRRSVYLHKLGEALSTQVADSLRGFHDQGYARVVVPKTIFPSLEQATVNYAGPERRSPSERFLHSFYIQAALPRSGTAGSRGAHPLWKTKLREKSVEDVAISLANFLGFLHGLTLGFRLYLDERYINGSGEKSSDEICGPAATDINGVAETKREIFRLVIRHLDQVRFGQPVTFRTWLEKGAHRPGRVQALLGRVKERVPGVGSLVEALLVQDGPGLGELWSKTVEESAACQNRFGVVGHMALRATNIYVESKNSDEDSWEDLYYSDQRLYGAKPCTRIAKIHLPIHHGLSMIDPALEAGLVLDELITARWGI